MFSASARANQRARNGQKDGPTLTHYYPYCTYGTEA